MITVDGYILWLLSEDVDADICFLGVVLVHICLDLIQTKLFRLQQIYNSVYEICPWSNRLLTLKLFKPCSAISDCFVYNDNHQCYSSLDHRDVQYGKDIKCLNNKDIYFTI